MSLTSTQAAILAAALRHPQHLVAPPARLAPAPRDAIRKSLLAKGLIEPAAVEAPDDATAWPADGAPAHFRISDAGSQAIGTEPAADAGGTEAAGRDGPQAPQGAPLAPPCG